MVTFIFVLDAETKFVCGTRLLFARKLFQLMQEKALSEQDARILLFWGTVQVLATHLTNLCGQQNIWWFTIVHGMNES